MSEPRPDIPRTSWWGDYSLAVGDVRRWRIGPLDLWIALHRYEWLIYSRQGDDPLDSSLEIATPVAEAPPRDPSIEVTRVGTAGTHDGVVLEPRLADRTIIVRPRDTFHVVEGSSVELFVSSPLWVAIHARGGSNAGGGDGETKGGKLAELPTYRPSDTWFGPSTLQGEAAYAVSTTCRVDVENLPVRPHRAVTPLRVENPGPGELAFQRLAVPVPNLSLFAGQGGRLWTEALQVKRSEEGAGLGELEVVKGAPGAAGSSEQISPPRQATPRRMMHMFDGIF